MEKPKTPFDLPEDVALRLMDEAETEARAANKGQKPFAMDVLGLFNRKARQYWENAERTVH